MTPPRLARSGGITLVFVMTGAALAFLATLTVSNASGPRAAGQFFQLVGLFAIATTFSTFGADTGLVRTVSALTARREFSSIPVVLRIAARPVLILAAVVAGLAIVLVNVPALVREPAGVDDAVLLAAPFLVLGTIMNLAFGTLRGLHLVPTFSFLQNVLLPGLRVAGVLLVVTMGSGFLSLTAVWTAPIAVVMAVAVLLVHRFLPRPEPTSPDGPAPAEEVRRFWSFSSARGVAAIVETLHEWADVLLVAWFMGPAAGGVYGVVTRCIRMGLMLEHTARIVTGPSISAALAVKDLATARTLYTRTAAVLVCGAWPFYLSLIVFGPAILSVFGSGFDDGYPPMLIIASAMLLYVPAGGVQSLLLMSGRSRWQLINKSTALIVAIVLNLWLIPQWGLMGAATAYAASVLTDTGLALLQSIRWLGIAPRWSVVAGIALLTSVVAGVGGLLVRHLFGAELTGLFVHLVYMGVVASLSLVFFLRRGRTRSTHPGGGTGMSQGMDARKASQHGSRDK